MINDILQQALILGRQAAENGKVATYIPELGKADKKAVGICLRTAAGDNYTAGDVESRFSIQSISKVISLAAAIENCGYDAVFERVGVEPSGESFNSLVELDINQNRPYNPMINSGAITVSSILTNYMTYEDMLEYARRICLDPDIQINRPVYESEMENISRNKAIAYLLESKDILKSSVERSLMFYTKMCSMNVTAQSLANLGLVLAADGCSPLDGKRLMDSRTVRLVKTIMLTCGMYDESGEFAVKVGMPAKSGVGGGLLAVADRQMGIGIYGPALDYRGNSAAGSAILEYISESMNLHMFGRGIFSDC